MLGESNRDDIDPDSIFSEGAGDATGVSQVFIAVGHDDKSACCIFWKGSFRKFQCRFEAGDFRVKVDDRLEPTDRWQRHVDGRNFNFRFSAENDHPCPVAGFRFAVFVNFLDDIVQHVLPFVARNTFRLIENEQDRELIAGSDHLKFCECKNDEQDNKGAKAQRAEATKLS